MTTIPLSIWPPPTPAILATLRAAKSLIETDTLIQPLEALPGGPGPILAFGTLPPFAADIVFIREESTTNPERVAAALRHWLDGGVPTYTMADILSLWMGAPVREIIDELELREVEYALDQQRARLS